MRLKKEDLKEIRERFKAMDVDKTGYISKENLKQIFLAMGEKISDKEADEMIKFVDIDGDGKVTLDEFILANAEDYDSD